MREETRKKLERAIWRDRARKIAIGLAILAAIGAAIAYQNLDLEVENKQVAGKIDAIDPLVSKTNSSDGLNVGVKLDDGRHVRVIVLKSHEPHIGDPITVVEHHHGTGRITHTLK